MNDLFTSGGIKKGELVLCYSARHAGKSYLNQLYNQNLCKEIMMTGQEALKELVELKLGFAELNNNKQKKKVKEYKFSRAKWYKVQLPGPFTNVAGTRERVEWCIANFGPKDTHVDPWNTRWYVDWDTINFRDSQDYEWYMLRWS